MAAHSSGSALTFAPTATCNGAVDTPASYSYQENTVQFGGSRRRSSSRRTRREETNRTLVAGVDGTQQGSKGGWPRVTAVGQTETAAVFQGSAASLSRSLVDVCARCH